MRIADALVFDAKEGFVHQDLCIREGRIAECGEGELISAPGCYLIPGLTDLHFHGCRGRTSRTAIPRGWPRWPPMSCPAESPRSAPRG